MIYDIIQFPSDILKEKSISIQKVDSDLKQFGKDLIETMLNNGGLGLAAIQVGKPLRILCMQRGNGQILLMYNPILLSQSSKRDSMREGCLSFNMGQDKYEVKRSTEVKVKYSDENNKRQFITLSDLDARVFLHEYDHLSGITLEDKKI